MTEFYTIVTQKGIETLTECMEKGNAFSATKMSVGDGNGSYYEITDAQTELKNVRYTASLYSKGKRNDCLFFNIQLPPSIGGFTVREVGLFDNEDNLLAIAKYPETYKQQAEDTSSKTILIEIQIKLSNEAFNTIIVDNSGELVTREEIEAYNQESLLPLIASKQDNLTAGDNVVINNNIISANNNVLYSINSGNCNASGEADLIDAVATTVITDSTETTQTVTKTVNPQYTTPGTYTFNAPVDGYYLVDVVGGGGNGIQHVNQYFVYSHGGGGSGAGFRGELYLTAGNHTITVGGACGGSSIDNLIIAGGGGNASMNNTVNATAGSGGVLTVTGQTQNVQVQANGNSGATATGSPCAGGASVYCGWGAGGASNGSPATGVVTLYRQWQETITTGGTSETVIAGSASVNYKIGGNYPAISATDLNGKSFSINGINTDDISTLADGTYHKFVGADGSSELIKNTIYRQALSPAANVGDVWINTALEPFSVLKYNGSSWESYDKIPLGEIVVSNGVVSAFKTFPYNQNGYNANMRSPLGKPSGKITDLPTTASGGAVTAPYNGYVQLAALACNSIQIYNNSRTGFWNAVANQAGNAASVCVPCQKGDVIQIYYEISTPRWFRCYADEGAI